MNLGVRLKGFRLLKGYTQQELAEKVRTTSKTISDYERNISEPNIEMLKDLASALGTDVNQIIDCNEQENQILEDDFLFALYGETKDLSSDEKQDILDIVKQARKMLKK